MSTEQKLYWLTRLDNLQGLFIALAVVTGILLFIYYIAMIINIVDSCFDWDDDNEVKKFAKGKVFWTWVLFLFGLITCLMIPTRNEVVFIIAGGKTIDFIDKDSSINKIPSQSTKLVTDFLQNQIKTLESK